MTSKLIPFVVFVALLGYSWAQKKEPFTLDEFLNGTFVNHGWNSTWISDDTFIYLYKDVYYKYNAEKHTKEVFLTKNVLKDYPAATFQLQSADGDFLLVKYNEIAIFRHSKRAQYALFNLKTRVFQDVANKMPLQYCKWTKKKNAYVYVQDNNIYYAEGLTILKKITNDGEANVKFNGVPDWVYEEEVLGTGEAIWLSPSGDLMGYATFDDRKVQSISYVMYGMPNATWNDPYPRIINISYPKVGTPNPTYDFKMYNIKTQTSCPLSLANGAETNQRIIYDVSWKDESAMVLTLNRIQNSFELHQCNCTSMACTTERSGASKDGWLSLKAPLYRKEMDAQIVSINDFPHLQLTFANKTMKTLTSGKRTVTNIYGFSDNGNLLYFSGNLEANFSQQHVFSINVHTRLETCLTCKLSTPEGNCTYAAASFSTSMNHVALECRGPGPGYVVLRNMKTSKDHLFESNELLRQQMRNKALPERRDFIFDQGSYSIAVRLLLPPNFDQKKKYPLVVNVYAGPNSNQISDMFNIGFQHYIVTNHQYIYAYIDGRGSGRRGDKLMHAVYKKLGTVEVEDQIIAARQLINMNGSFIDPNRTAIWGWSYGGFATAWVMVKDTQNVFKCGLSVAPVTNFLLYDTIYTERYMALPTNNQDGYKNTDVTSRAKDFMNKTYFLIHGNADDNVHYQQSMLLARALELADVSFRMMNYPDENHSLRGVSRHLYHSIDKYWEECFNPKSTYGTASSHSPVLMLLVAVLVVLKFM